MRIQVFESPGWREPVIAGVEETYDETSLRMNRRAVRWILKDNKQFEHLARLRAGTLCSECMEVFPAKPSAATVAEFRRVYGDKPEPMASCWQRRVEAGCCPVCASEVSTEFFEALHEGVLPSFNQSEEDA